MALRTWLRYIALNLLRGETSIKRSLKGKRMKAALDENYLRKVLTGYMREPQMASGLA